MNVVESKELTMKRFSYKNIIHKGLSALALHIFIAFTRKDYSVYFKVENTSLQSVFQIAQI